MSFPPTPVLGELSLCNTVVDKYALIAALMQSRQVFQGQIPPSQDLAGLSQLLITHKQKWFIFGM
jgi:hypothetical protein